MNTTHDAPVTDNPAGITTEQVWKEVQSASFAVVSQVTPDGQPRSSGVLIKAVGRKIFVVTAVDSWKARHLATSGKVAVTIPVRRGWILALLLPIPPATICFHGSATVHPPGAIPVPEELEALLPAERRSDCSIVEIAPEGRFLTYGIGVPLLRMRDTSAARGHAPVASSSPAPA